MRDNMTRLKWFRTPDGKIKSEPVLAGSEVMKAIINQKDLTLEIKDLKEKVSFARAKADSVRKLKETAKTLFKDMHGSFCDEIRPKHLKKKKKKLVN